MTLRSRLFKKPRRENRWRIYRPQGGGEIALESNLIKVGCSFRRIAIPDGKVSWCMSSFNIEV